MLGRRLLVVPVMVLALAGTGCHTMAFDVALERPVSKTVHQRKAFFFWGLVPTQKVVLTNYCPNGVVQVQEEESFTDGLLHLMTLGLYAPISSWYYCAAETTQ